MSYNTEPYRDGYRVTKDGKPVDVKGKPVYGKSRHEALHKAAKARVRG